MLGSIRQALALMVVLTCVPLVWGQEFWHDRPKEYAPTRPPSQKELDARESLNLYVLGLLCEREDRLLEAVHAFEKAARLDPQAAGVFKALVPFYLALDRFSDALAATRKVVDLDPADFEAWYLYARQLKNLGKVKEAQAALGTGLAVPALKEQPESAQAMHFLLGNLHESAGEFVAAGDAYLQAAKILDHPDVILEHLPVDRDVLSARSAELYERAGTMFVQARRFDQAVAVFRQAQARQPDSAGRLNYNLALVFKEQGKLPQALDSLDAYLRLQPQGLEAYELKIGLMQKLRRDADILPWLEKASAADGFNTGLKLLLARTYTQLASRERQRPEIADQAEKLYQELAARAPSADIYRGLFKLYRQEPRLGMARALAMVDNSMAAKKDGGPPNGDPAQVQAMIAVLRDDAELAREFIQAGQRQLEAGRKLTSSTVHLLAILADRHRQLDAAERFYRQCLRQPAPNTEDRLYMGLLDVLWKARKYEDILNVCQEGLRRFPASPVLFSERARALAQLGKVDQALAEVERALDVAPDPFRFRLRHQRVRLLSMAERHDKAEAECLAMLKDFPQPGDVMETRYLLSSVYSGARDFAKAEAQLAWVLRVDPANATANNDLGYLWADQNKNLKEAEELIRKAIDLHRQQRKKNALDADLDHAAYIDSLGWALFRQGQMEAARRELEKAVALPDGEDPTIWDHLGDVYYRLRQVDQARSAWQRALHLYDREKHHRMDQRHKDVERKLKLLDSARQP